jgi:hypothetical protein
MTKDRTQKQKALRLSVAHRWFPQLEVDVEPGRAVSEKTVVVTDLDVLASIPDEFAGFRSVVFDCKTGPKESPVNRALWLAGVLRRLGADQGFCILKKDAIELDHRFMANRLKVILLAENEFDLYATATSKGYSGSLGNISEMEAWEQFFDIASQFTGLQPGLHFLRSSFWMTDDAAEACRKTLATLRILHPELDPSKPAHVAVFFDFCALFARALAILVSQIFKAYLHPANQSDLSEALLVMLYGGREAYQHRNDLFKLVKAKNPDQLPADLSLPEWDRFLQLARQLLDAPTDLQHVPLILREVGFSLLRGDIAKPFAKLLCGETPQAARFAILVANYLCRAAKLPPEFAKIADDVLLPLVPVK